MLVEMASLHPPTEMNKYDWKEMKGTITIEESLIKDGCDGIKHPEFNYRPYRRGSWRCSMCGGKRSLLSKLEDVMYSPGKLIHLHQLGRDNR